MSDAKPRLGRVAVALALAAPAAGLLTAVLLQLMVIVVAIVGTGGFDPPRGLAGEATSFLQVLVAASGIYLVGLVLVSPLWLLAHRIGLRTPLAAMLFGALLNTGAMLLIVGDLGVVATLVPVGPLIGLLIWRIAYGPAPPPAA